MEAESQPKEKIERALARSAIYHFLSLAFLFPEEELLSVLKDEATFSEMEVCSSSLDPKGRLTRSLAGLRRSAQKLKALNHLEAQYGRIFGHTLSTECPPYETQYGASHIFQQAQDMGDIGGFYRAFGLELSQDTKERLDHISVELEFMHFLAYKEAYAWEQGAQDKALLCAEVQKRFVADHLGRWVPCFAEQVVKKARQGVYGHLARFTKEFILLEADLLAVSPERVSLSPIIFKPEDFCDSCTLTGEGKEEG